MSSNSSFNQTSNNSSTSYISIEDLEFLLASDLKNFNELKFKDILEKMLATLVRDDKNDSLRRKEIEDLRYQLNALNNPVASAEQAILGITEEQREVLFNRYTLMKVQELEEATLSAERSKVATLSSLNKIRFALNSLLSDPLYGPDIKTKMQNIISNIDNSSIIISQSNQGNDFKNKVNNLDELFD